MTIGLYGSITTILPARVQTKANNNSTEREKYEKGFFTVYHDRADSSFLLLLKAYSQASDKAIKLGTLSTLQPFMTKLKDELIKKGYKVELVLLTQTTSLQ